MLNNFNPELLIVVIIISIVVIFQFSVFVSVLKRIRMLKSFFPDISDISIKNKIFDNDRFGDSGFSTEVVEYTGTDKIGHFHDVLESINKYLVNNKGSAANFNILIDIVERHIDTLVNRINSTVSVPLFLGLVGTFAGIIAGLGMLDFSEAENGSSILSTESLGGLINGVIIAMIASMFGLLLTIINSSWLFKNAAYKNESDKNLFYDLIQGELLPKLSKDVSDSLGTLKENLDHFNNKFGENLINYKESFQLLNDNLVNEKEFLEAIQQVGIVKLSDQIVKTFEDINTASNDFHEFKKYQNELNKVVSSSIAVLKEYSSVSATFNDFNQNLKLVSENIIESSDFYHQFKTFLETHFSDLEERRSIFTETIEKIDDVLTQKLKELSNKSLEQKDFYNEQWRSTVDQLNEDIGSTFSKFSEFVEKETESLRNYIISEEEGLKNILESNKEFFKDFKFVEQIFDKISAHAEISNIHNKNIETGLSKIADLISGEGSLIEVNRNLIEIRAAIEKLSMSLNKHIELSYEKEAK